MSSHAEHVVIVGGPTASGKSALALALAERFDGVVINADSMQVYRDLAVLTARPSAAALSRAPHRLYGVLDAADPCSAARWRDLALAEIGAARDARRLPILVGGTGLYLRGLLQGLAAVPPIPPALREEARALHARLGGTGFREALAALDPDGAARLAAGDAQRLIRAYEVAAATGRPLGEWQRLTPPDRSGLHVAALILMPPRPHLYAACNARLWAMVDQGGLAELRRLLARGLDPGLPVMKALGVPELARHLAGEATLEAAVARAQQATRRYAKRQVTWFRHQMPREPLAESLVIEAQFSESLLPETFSFIRVVTCLTA